MTFSCDLAVTQQSKTENFQCTWYPVSQTKGSGSSIHESLDIILRRKKNVDLAENFRFTNPDNDDIFAVCYDENTNNLSKLKLWDLAPGITDFLVKAVESCGTDDGSFIVLKFVLSTVEGYISRSDFLEQRLKSVERIQRVTGLLCPRAAVIARPKDTGTGAYDLSKLLAIAVGAILLDSGSSGPQSQQAILGTVEDELINRLSFPWVVSTPVPQKRLAWVEGRKDADASRRMYEAAATLGITLVIIDKPGHWLQDDLGPFAYLREAFISTNIDVDEGFVDRIVAAVRSYNKKIDGLMTVSDARLTGVARACEKLGFSTAPSSSYALAGDKYQTRILEPESHGAFRVFGTDHLRELLDAGDRANLTYPLIVKPCLGWGSQAVTKASTEDELFKAVGKASVCHSLSPQNRVDAVVEPYIDGPEIDMNFVLLDEEVVFFEVSDDFPSPGDKDDKQSHNFVETAVVLPSVLPQNEIDMVRDSLHQSILRQGFRTGVFHCEARLQYSSYEFRAGDDGYEDLYPRQRNEGVPSRKVRAYLLEINARPPGYLETVGVHFAYGIDYFAQQMLFAVNDEERFRAICHPFLRGPQYNLSVLILQEETAGIMKSEDAGAELMRRHPDLSAHVPLYATIKKKGDRLVGPLSSEVHFIAWFLVTAKDRRNCLRLVDKVRSEFQYEVEEL